MNDLIRMPNILKTKTIESFGNSNLNIISFELMKRIRPSISVSQIGFSKLNN